MTKTNRRGGFAAPGTLAARVLDRLPGSVNTIAAQLNAGPNSVRTILERATARGLVRVVGAEAGLRGLSKVWGRVK